jgi:hypothetical protein
MVIRQTTLNSLSQWKPKSRMKAKKRKASDDDKEPPHDFPRQLARAMCSIRDTDGDDILFVGDWCLEDDPDEDEDGKKDGKKSKKTAVTRAFDNAFNKLNDFTTNAWNLRLEAFGNTVAWMEAKHLAMKEDPCRDECFPQESQPTP